MNGRTDKEMPRTARDPHHNGAAEWGWDGQHLWHRQYQQRWWTKVKRIHPTPARVKMLSKLMIKMWPRPVEEHWAKDLL